MPSAIIISSDSSMRGGITALRRLIFCDIPTVIPSTYSCGYAPETSTISSCYFPCLLLWLRLLLSHHPTGLCVLVPNKGSESDSPDEMSSPEHRFPRKPAYFTIHKAPIHVLRLLTHLNGPRKLLIARKRVGPLPARRLTLRHASPRSPDHHSSSSSSSSDSLPVHSLGLDASDQAHSGSSTRDVSPRLCYPPRRAPRCSEAFRRWCAAPLSTWYPPTTSESSSGDSPERPMHLSSHSARTILRKKEDPRLIQHHYPWPIHIHLRLSLEEDCRVVLRTVLNMEFRYSDGDEVGDHVEIDLRGCQTVGGRSVKLVGDRARNGRDEYSSWKNLKVSCYVDIERDRVEQPLFVHSDNVDGNENHNVNGRGDRLVARECTYHDFMKCQPQVLKEPKEWIWQIRRVERWRLCFSHQQLSEKYQVKYATCTNSSSALPVESHQKPSATDAADTLYTWIELTTETKIVLPKNESKRGKTELWNLTYKTIKMLGFLFLSNCQTTDDQK
ncbi:hypothetical protein Tco_0285050 [Tanacetum coccineum]